MGGRCIEDYQASGRAECESHDNNAACAALQAPSRPVHMRLYLAYATRLSDADQWSATYKDMLHNPALLDSMLERPFLIEALTCAVLPASALLTSLLE